jgi:hypothetical protein
VSDELVESLGVEGDAEVSIDSLDCKRRTEKVLATDEEVRRSDHSAGATFRIVGLHIGLACVDVVEAELTDPQQFGGMAPR